MKNNKNKPTDKFLNWMDYDSISKNVHYIVDTLSENDNIIDILIKSYGDIECVMNIIIKAAIVFENIEPDDINVNVCHTSDACYKKVSILSDATVVYRYCAPVSNNLITAGYVYTCGLTDSMQSPDIGYNHKVSDNNPIVTCTFNSTKKYITEGSFEDKSYNYAINIVYLSETSPIQ